MGKKKLEVLEDGVRGLPRGHDRQRFLRPRRSRRCGTPSSRSPATRSTSRTPPATAWSRTGPRTSRPTIRPSTWPACSPRSVTTRTRPRSTWRTAAGWASPCCRRTSTNRVELRLRRRRTSASGWAPCATSAPTSSASIIEPAEGEGQVHRLLRLPEQDRHRRLQQEGHRVADQGRRVRLARPSAQGPVPGAHRRGRLGDGHQEGRGDRPVRPVRRRPTTAPPTRCSPSRCPTTSGTTSTSSRWNGRCWACTCPGTRSTASSTCCSGQVDTADPGDPRRRHRQRRARYGVGGILAGVNRRVNKNGMPWASAQLEDLTGGIEVMFFPHAYSSVRRGDHR